MRLILFNLKMRFFESNDLCGLRLLYLSHFKFRQCPPTPVGRATAPSPEPAFSLTSSVYRKIR
ncbi:hypothetical protein EQU24_05860 [Methylotuvimicrobium buryatense]|uniref:Uncharacterized protein n=1 Tax=Methylotuvimicrobium buryatense TaxID=95641 RepID=A0A4P9UQF9_METBY|nr:hypothetical protein EQU24_05860 [Methylotuvimicrobium buryatense]